MSRFFIFKSILKKHIQGGEKARAEKVNTDEPSWVFEQSDFISSVSSGTFLLAQSPPVSSSLCPSSAVDKRLRLLGRPARFPEKPSDGPGLGRGAPVPLEDQQSSDEEPEEEVDPRCRLREAQRGEKPKRPRFAAPGGDVYYSPPL